jgi:hypothetical protein
MDLRTVAPLRSATLQELYGAPLVLIRPDQIVAWRGHDARSASAVVGQATGRANPSGTRQPNQERRGKDC